ncbi:MAG: hypothetical protein U1F56_16495 [Rubrivivax sp.]
MTDTPAARAASAAWVTVLLFIACLLLMIWQADGRYATMPALPVLLGLVMACTVVLHLIFVALLAQRLGRRARWFVLGALLTLPMGSLVGLILYEWHTSVDRPQPGRTT